MRPTRRPRHPRIQCICTATARWKVGSGYYCDKHAGSRAVYAIATPLEALRVA